jgi:glutamate-5-semialdehyde dehydrogenase
LNAAGVTLAGMAIAAATVEELCRRAKAASRLLAGLDRRVRDAALERIATTLAERVEEILEANADDVARGREAGLDDALIDRLSLSEERIAAIAAGVRAVAALPDPVGEVIEGRRLPNGLDLRRVRVPLGVVAVVYEARPNVTIDCAALCLKSGNAVVLRGSSSAERSNAILATIAAQAAAAEGVPADAIVLVPPGERGDDLRALATAKDTIDLIIPRGGEGLKRALEAVATVPVIYAAAGNCHVYVDAHADLDRARRIVINAKTQRPGVCNACETLLVHSAVAPRFVPAIVDDLLERGVELRVCARTQALAKDRATQLRPATEDDWRTEYLAPILAVRVVDTLDEAVEHIARYGSGHSEAIVTASTDAARAFCDRVDAACVYVNASTRFTDGYEFGLGAEIGNSTQKLHARGPIGLRELTTYKYIVEGTGHVRE